MAQIGPFTVPDNIKVKLTAILRERGFDKQIVTGQDGEGNDVFGPDPAYDPIDAFVKEQLRAEIRAARSIKLDEEIAAEEAKPTPDDEVIKIKLLQRKRL